MVLKILGGIYGLWVFVVVAHKIVAFWLENRIRRAWKENR